MKHGGASIYVATKFNLDFSCINVEELSEEQQFEAAVVVFPVLNIFTDNYEKFILFINKSYKYKNSTMLIIGDINTDPWNNDLN